MSNDTEGRLDNLELVFGIKEEKEPTTYEGFLEQYPDYGELEKYYRSKFDEADKEATKKFGKEEWVKVVGEAVQIFEKDPRYLNDKKLQRAKRCTGYYYELHPDGKKEAEIIEKYFSKNAG